MSYPELHITRCTQCKRCTEECPFGMYNEDAKGTPLPYPTRCRRCSICMGSCPERIISFNNYSVDMIGSMIEEHSCSGRGRREAPHPGPDLQNDSNPALDLLGLHRFAYPAWIRLVAFEVPGFPQPGLDRGRLVQGDRRRAAAGMPIRRRLPVPLHARKRTGQHPYVEDIGNTRPACSGIGPGPRGADLAIDDYHRLPGIIEAFSKRIEEID